MSLFYYKPYIKRFVADWRNIQIYSECVTIC